MNILKKIELGVLVTITIAMISFAFWLGRLDQRVENLDQRLSKLETNPKALLDQNPIPAKVEAMPPSVTLTIASNIDLNHAPFKIGVNGTVKNATQFYTYIVVDDGHAEWIQPGLGFNRDGPFYSSAHLGIKDGNPSLNKWYNVFAVVSGEEHEKYQHLKPDSILARTKPTRIYRTQ
ncbi:MAG: hypothetical protein OEV42_12950 [Deltaproteobacteria bacterium]|nr:hypothetical protein [Deltaproteobacteria bacterium]